jgi:RecA/RadA recombinase
MSRAETIAALRQHIAQVAPHRGGGRCATTGIPSLDVAIGGWPRPGVASIHGAVGSGRMGLVLPAIVAHTQRARTVAVVDAIGWLYPPGLPGVDLRYLMIVRPGSARAAWAAVQLAGSGAVPLTVLLDPPRIGRNGLRLSRAAERGDSTVIVIGEARDADMVAGVRMAVQGGGQVQIERGGGGALVI